MTPSGTTLYFWPETADVAAYHAGRRICCSREDHAGRLHPGITYVWQIMLKANRTWRYVRCHWEGRPLRPRCEDVSLDDFLQWQQTQIETC